MTDHHPTIGIHEVEPGEIVHLVYECTCDPELAIPIGDTFAGPIPVADLLEVHRRHVVVYDLTRAQLIAELEAASDDPAKAGEHYRITRHHLDTLKAAAGQGDPIWDIIETLEVSE